MNGLPGIEPIRPFSRLLSELPSDFNVASSWGDITGWDPPDIEGIDLDFDETLGIVTIRNTGSYFFLLTASVDPSPPSQSAEIRIVEDTGSGFVSRVNQPVDTKSTATASYQASLTSGDQVKPQAQDTQGPTASLLADATKFVVVRVR